MLRTARPLWFWIGLVYAIFVFAAAFGLRVAGHYVGGGC